MSQIKTEIRELENSPQTKIYEAKARHKLICAECSAEHEMPFNLRAVLLSPTSKLFMFSVIYGLFYINYIDLVVPGSAVPGYHAWLGVTYFISFIPVILIWGVRKWKLVLCLSLMASLMNDLFYYPVSLILLGKAPDLYNWYLFQLGFKGLAHAWTFNAGFLIFPMTSLLMGASIYLRTAAIAVLAVKGKASMKSQKSGGPWNRAMMCLELLARP